MDGDDLSVSVYTARAKDKPEESYPKISGEQRFEIENNTTYHSQAGGRGRKRNLLFATFEPEIAVEFSENLSINGEVQLEPVLDFDEDGNNQEFDKQGIFLEQLNVEWKKDRLDILVGKFEPTFGLSFEASRDIFGDEYAFEYQEFSEDAELTERLGARVGFELGNDSVGSHNLTLDLFDSDTSSLSRSIIRKRGRLRRRDGGPSNSGRFKSFGLNLIGEEIPQLPGLGYHVGFVYQDSGKVRPEDAEDEDEAFPVELTGRPQRSYVIGASYDYEMSEDLEFRFFTDYLYLDNADGNSDVIRNLLTVQGSAIIRKDLYLGFSYARRQQQNPGDRDNNDYLLQTTATYYRDLGPERRFGRLGFEFALRPSRQDRARQGQVGLRLLWVSEF